MTRRMAVGGGLIVLALLLLFLALSSEDPQPAGPTPNDTADRPDTDPPTATRRRRRTPVEENPVPDPEPASTARRVCARYAHSGELAAGLTLGYRSQETDEGRLVLDAEGTASLPDGQIEEFTVVGHPWRVVRRRDTQKEVPDVETVFLIEMQRFEIRVRDADDAPIPTAMVQLSLAFGGVAGRAMGKPDADTPGSVIWAGVLGLENHFEREDPLFGEHGFLVSSALFPGAILHVRAKGYRGAKVRLPDRAVDDRLLLDVQLERPSVLKGRVVDEEGRPLAGVRVLAFVTGQAPLNDEDPFKYRLPGRSFSAIGSGDTLYFWHDHPGRTDAEGRFVIPLYAEGPIELVAFPPGASQCTQHIRPAEVAAGHEFELRATKGNGGRVRVAAGTRALEGYTVRFHDVSRREWQMTIDLGKSDKNGEVPTDWLHHGRLYHIWVEAPDSRKRTHTGYLEWRGQTVIDVEKDLSIGLPKR